MNGMVSGHLEDLGHDRWRMVANLPAILEDGPAQVSKDDESSPSQRPAACREGPRQVDYRPRGPRRHRPDRITVGELVRRWLDDVNGTCVQRPCTSTSARRACTSCRPWAIARAARSRRRTCRASTPPSATPACRSRASTTSTPRCAPAGAGRSSEDLVERNPADRVKRPPRQVREERQVWTQDTVARAAIAADGLVVGVPMVLAAWCGLRRGEVCGLRWDTSTSTADAWRSPKCSSRPRPAPSTSSHRRRRTASASFPCRRRSSTSCADTRRARTSTRSPRRAWNKDGYVVCRHNGQPMKPDNLSSAWSSFVRSHGLPDDLLPRPAPHLRDRPLRQRRAPRDDAEGRPGPARPRPRLDHRGHLSARHDGAARSPWQSTALGSAPPCAVPGKNSQKGTGGHSSSTSPRGVRKSPANRHMAGVAER